MIHTDPIPQRGSPGDGSQAQAGTSSQGTTPARLRPSPTCDVDAEGWCDAHACPWEDCKQQERSRRAKRNRAKGREFERRVAAWLRSQGYVVDDLPRGKIVRGPGGRVFSTPVDFFGAFDILALHPTGPDDVWLIQCTDGGDVAAKRKKVEAAVPFGIGYKLSVFEAHTRQDDVDRRRLKRLARVHSLEEGGWGPVVVVDLNDTTPLEAEG